VKRLAICLIACVALSGAFASGASALKEFKSPSGNIGCLMSAKFVRCDIREHTYPNPPQPQPCYGDYDGNVLGVGVHGRGEVSCASDSALDPAFPVLAYGDRIDNRRFRCASKTKGMRCVNLRNKHGFFVSRADLRLF
jgi:hypothetical protein